jgi:hypothetical protein
LYAKISFSSLFGLSFNSKLIIGKNRGKENMNKAFEEMTEARNRFIINKMTTLEVESTRVSVRNATKEELGEIITSHYNVKITSVEN